MQVDMAVENGFLMTMDVNRPDMEKGTVLIRDGMIKTIAVADPMPEYQARAAIDAEGKLVMPGLVNAHTHLGGCVFRGLLDDWVYPSSGLYELAFPVEMALTEEDYYWLHLLGAVETVKAGSTTVADMYHHSSTVAQAALEVGLRAVVAHKVFDCHLPAVGSSGYTRYEGIRRERVGANLKLIEEWHGRGNGRITCRFGTHATDTCSRTLLQQARRIADEYGVGLHIHVAQSSTEVAHIRETHCMSPVAYLASLGFLGPDVLTVHLTLATGDDLDILEDTGAVYAHCPPRYGRRGKYPPLKEAYLDRSIPTGFGTDWLRMDMWDGMRQAASNAALASGRGELLSAVDLLSLATRESAGVLGLAGQVGEIREGLQADLIIIDLSEAKFHPFYGVPQGLVFHVDGNDVHTVIIAGEEVVRNGRCLRVDEEAIVREVRRRIPRFLQAVREVMPHHRVFSGPLARTTETENRKERDT